MSVLSVKEASVFKTGSRILLFLAECCLVFVLVGCSLSLPSIPSGSSGAGTATGEAGQHTLSRMGYGTQVGAFRQLNNAVRLEAKLQAQGVDAYYFRHASGLYKVRFGDHKTYEASRKEAERLKARGIIDVFFTVLPTEYSAARTRSHKDQSALRSELVQTAKRFLGVPYRWGGTDKEGGFDCSGLTMVTYRLNGLNLPRVSRSQFRAGRPVTKQNLAPGDLVFFATQGGNRVTHVGMVVGPDRFIHAPRAGKTVRIARLSNTYWRRNYQGGRTYL